MSKMNSFRTRSFRAGGYSFLAALIVLAFLVAVNVIMNALPTTVTKLDATQSKLTTLSDQTKNVLKVLDKDLTFNWLCQEGMEDPVVETLLNQYASSSGHIKLQKLDPAVNPGLYEQYTDEYYDNSVLITCGDRTRYVSYTDIYVMDYEKYYASGEEEWIFQGEDALTRSIYYLATDDVPKAYYITGHGETGFTDEQKNVFLDENIDLAQLKLVGELTIPEDADMLICYKPTADFSADETEVLKQYVTTGGKFLLVTGYMEQKLENLESIMAAYGVTSVDGMVLEGNSNYYSQYPYWLLPEPKTHAITDPVLSDRLNVLIPQARGLKVTQTGSVTTVVTELLVTTDQSYSKIGTNWTSTDKATGDIDGPFSLGVAVEDAVLGTKAVWFSSDYILDSNCGAAQDLFFNAVNWMCDQEELISIRGKDVTQQYLTMNEDAVTTMTWIVVAIVPLGFLVIGISIYTRRKKR